MDTLEEYRASRAIMTDILGKMDEICMRTAKMAKFMPELTTAEHYLKEAVSSFGSVMYALHQEQVRMGNLPEGDWE